MQDAEQLPVGPLPGGGGVAGVQGGGGLADVAADVDVVDEDGTFRPRPLAWSPAVICCLFPSTRSALATYAAGRRRSASSNADAIMDER